MLHGSLNKLPNNVSLSSDTGSLLHTEKFRYIIYLEVDLFLNFCDLILLLIVAASASFFTHFHIINETRRIRAPLYFLIQFVYQFIRIVALSYYTLLVSPDIVFLQYGKNLLIN